MARFKLFLGDMHIQSLEDFKAGLEATDAVEKFRDGAICRWLKARGYADLLARFATIDGNASEGNIIRSMLRAADIESGKIETLARQIARRRKAAKEEQERENAENTPTPAMVEEEYSLAKAFEKAVKSGDISRLCDETANNSFKDGATMGGHTFWNELARCDGWKVQQNKVFGNCRILDPDNLRKAYGGMSMFEALFLVYWKSKADAGIARR